MDSVAIGSGQYDTDKVSLNTDYLRRYEARLSHLRDREIRLLELGVLRGGSLLMWRDFFVHGTIVGLDKAPVAVDDPTGRVHVYRGEQQDLGLLDRVATQRAPEGFDVIIDDCSHLGELTRASFWHLFEHHLRPGGIYVIEDWGTGYNGHWPDGVQFEPRPAPPFRASAFRRRQAIVSALERGPGVVRGIGKRLTQLGVFQRHDYGMVGFVKELVDEVGWFQAEPLRISRFEELLITPGQVFVTKRLV
jgi:hypothetical protein